MFIFMFKTSRFFTFIVQQICVVIVNIAVYSCLFVKPLRLIFQAKSYHNI